MLVHIAMIYKTPGNASSDGRSLSSLRILVKSFFFHNILLINIIILLANSEDLSNLCSYIYTVFLKFEVASEDAIGRQRVNQEIL